MSDSQRPETNIDDILQDFYTETHSSNSSDTRFDSLINVLTSSNSGSLSQEMLEALQSIVADPAKSKGVPEEFIDSLDRVDKKTLKKDDTCPICTNEYLSDPHPLVVRLNHCSHKYDLDCIKPWLQVNSTCPMCRVDVLKKKEFDIPSDDEEEFDDMYG